MIRGQWSSLVRQRLLIDINHRHETGPLRLNPKKRSPAVRNAMQLHDVYNDVRRSCELAERGEAVMAARGTNYSLVVSCRIKTCSPFGVSRWFPLIFRTRSTVTNIDMKGIASLRDQTWFESYANRWITWAHWKNGDNDSIVDFWARQGVGWRTKFWSLDE